MITAEKRKRKKGNSIYFEIDFQKNNIDFETDFKQDDSDFEQEKNEESLGLESEEEIVKKRELSKCVCEECLEMIWNDPQREIIISCSLEAYRYACSKCEKKYREHLNYTEKYRCMLV